MTCCTASAVVTASVACLATVVAMGAASAVDFHHTPASLPVVPFTDGLHSDALTPFRGSPKSLREANSTGLAVAPLTARQQGMVERSVSGCGWSASRRCDKVERLGGAPVADRGVSVGVATAGFVITHPSGRTSEVATLHQLKKTASVSGQSSLAIPDRIGNLSTADGGSFPRPIGKTQAISFDSMATAADEERVPGPYAILLIGVSLAAFMAFRRMGDA